MNKLLHFRRCHLCNHVNMTKEKVVKKCQKCNKHLAPYYYFDERKLYQILQKKSALPNSYVRAFIQKRQGRQNERYPPLQGLSAYW